MILQQWARDHNIPEAAVRDLMARMGVGPTCRDRHKMGRSEASAQQRIRLAESKRGARLWRNNVGAATASDGRHIRYGLCNDSQALNRQIKSSDLIGVTPVVITPGMVGDKIGVFTAIEVKKPGWCYTATDREAAQFAWIELILGLGGIAKFSTGEEY